jgi:hypothetical protein
MDLFLKYFNDLNNIIKYKKIMAEKTKTDFNKDNDQVFKYNFVKIPSEIINALETLNLIQKDGEILNGKIKEYYHQKVLMDSKRTIHRIQFTLNE